MINLYKKLKNDYINKRINKKLIELEEKRNDRFLKLEQELKEENYEWTKEDIIELKEIINIVN